MTAVRRRRSEDGQGTSLTIGYLQYLHTHVYNVKRDVESRASSLIAVAVVYFAAAALVTNAAVALTSNSRLSEAAAWIAGGIGTLGSFAAFLSLILAIRVIWPQIADPGSPMLPQVVEMHSHQELGRKYARYSASEIRYDLTRELRAMAEVQVKKATTLKAAEMTLTAALLALVLATVALALGFAFP